MDKKKIKDQLNKAFEILNDNAQDPNSWFCLRMKSIENVSITDTAKLNMRIELEAKLMGLILESLKTGK